MTNLIKSAFCVAICKWYFISQFETQKLVLRMHNFFLKSQQWLLKNMKIQGFQQVPFTLGIFYGLYKDPAC
jgi:hypothetical protein